MCISYLQESIVIPSTLNLFTSGLDEERTSEYHIRVPNSLKSPRIVQNRPLLTCYTRVPDVRLCNLQADGQSA